LSITWAYDAMATQTKIIFFKQIAMHKYANAISLFSHKGEQLYASNSLAAHLTSKHLAHNGKDHI